MYAGLIRSRIRSEESRYSCLCCCVMPLEYSPRMVIRPCRLKPSGQRKRGRKDDRIREREWSESNKETGHETYPKLFERDQAVVSTHRTQVFGMSSHLARGGGGVQTHGDYPGRSDQAEPCGLSLPGPAVRGAHTDLSRCGSRCAGLAPLHLWARHCVAGGTTTPDGGADRR